LGLAQSLSRVVEQGSDIENAWFVDLFVKDTNKPAFELYRKMGYSVYRRITNYYGGNCDGLDMRKPMGRDVGHLHIVKEGEEFRVSPEDLW
jgi:N-terminal acetyltransferase B complex catalytic subunit